jgi:acetoin utilization protein AcuC
MKKSVFLYSEEFEKYNYPAGHPFSVTRPRRTRKTLDSMGLLGGEGRKEVAPQPAPRAVLEKFHTSRYLNTLQAAAKGNFEPGALGMGIGSSDCPAFEDMCDYSVLACGASLKGVELIVKGEADAAFNPSGGLHHAGPEQASGFCYMNDVALACMVFAEHGKKVLYLDVDVHHGDGVAYAFYNRSDVMTISFHQNPRTLFPGTGFEDEIGEGPGKGYCVNVPLPAGTYDEAYMKAFEELAVPLIGKFAPDVFVFELGADALAGDPLANLYLTNNTYSEIIASLQDFEKPILMTGGGGYNIDNTVRAWALAWSVLCGAGPQKELLDKAQMLNSRQCDMVIPQIDTVIEAVKENLFGIHGL